MGTLRAWLQPEIAAISKEDVYQRLIDRLGNSRPGLKDALVLRRRALLTGDAARLKEQAPDTAAALAAMALVDVVALTHRRSESLRTLKDNEGAVWAWVHEAASELFDLLAGVKRLPRSKYTYEMKFSLKPVSDGFAVAMAGKQSSEGATPGEALNRMLAVVLLEATAKDFKEVIREPEDLRVTVASLESVIGREGVAMACLLYLASEENKDMLTPLTRESVVDEVRMLLGKFRAG